MKGNVLRRVPPEEEQRRTTPYAIGGVLVASVATALLPRASGQVGLLALVPKIRERADGYYLGQAAAGLPPHRAVKAAEAPLL